MTVVVSLHTSVRNAHAYSTDHDVFVLCGIALEVLLSRLGRLPSAVTAQTHCACDLRSQRSQAHSVFCSLNCAQTHISRTPSSGPDSYARHLQHKQQQPPSLNLPGRNDAGTSPWNPNPCAARRHEACTLQQAHVASGRGSRQGPPGHCVPPGCFMSSASRVTSLRGSPTFAGMPMRTTCSPTFMRPATRLSVATLDAADTITLHLSPGTSLCSTLTSWQMERVLPADRKHCEGCWPGACAGSQLQRGALQQSHRQWMGRVR